MKGFICALATSVAVLVAAPAATAQVILWTDNFSSYDSVTGGASPLNAIWNTSGSGLGTGIVFATDPGAVYGQTVRRNDTPPGRLGRFLNPAGTSLNYTPTVANPLILSWSMYDSTAPVGVQGLSSAELSGGTGGSVSAGIAAILNGGGTPSNPLKFQASLDGATAFDLATNRKGVPGWTDFQLVIGGGFGSLFIDGSATPDANFNNLALVGGAAGTFNRVRIGSSTSLSPFFPPQAAAFSLFDNFIVSVPEPGTFTLMAAGAGMLLLAMRKRRS